MQKIYVNETDDLTRILTSPLVKQCHSLITEWSFGLCADRNFPLIKRLTVCFKKMLIHLDYPIPSSNRKKLAGAKC